MSCEPALYLGVDGGQSSTESLVANGSGNILGRGIAGPCNHVSGAEAIKRFRSAIADSLREACNEAGVSIESTVFAGACLGLSGGPDDKAEHVMAIVKSRRYKITHDAEIALTGALDGEPGVIVIAGTGSIAFGKNAAGRTARAGGWGYVFGDEGGAFDVVRRALRASLRMEEGWGPPTVLRDRLVNALSVSDANTVLHSFYRPSSSRSAFAALAGSVDAAAEEGDPAAVQILRECANDLAIYAAGAYRHVFESPGPPVTYTGGVFESRILLAAFTEAINGSLRCAVFPPRRSPAEGAVIEALRLP